LESDWLNLSSADLKILAASIYPTDVPAKKEERLENTGLDTEMDSPETSDPSASPPITESSTEANVTKETNFSFSLRSSSPKRSSSSPPSRSEQDTQPQPVRRSESHEMPGDDELSSMPEEEKKDSKDLLKENVKEEEEEEEEEDMDYTYALEDDFSFSESLRSYSESHESNLHVGTLPFALSKVSTASRLRTDRTDLSHPSELSIRTFTRTDSESVQSAQLPIRPEFGGLLTSEDLSQRSLRHVSKIIRKNDAHQPVFETRGTKKPDRKPLTSEKSDRKVAGKSERSKPAEPPSHLSSLSKVSVALGKGSKKASTKEKGKEIQPTEKEKSRSIFSFKSVPQKKSADEVKKKEKDFDVTIDYQRADSHDSKKTEDLRPRKKKLSSSTAPLMSEQTQVILGVHLTPDCVFQPINPNIRPQIPNDMLLPCLPEIRQKALGGDLKK
jgi:hypothetical protein